MPDNGMNYLQKLAYDSIEDKQSFYRRIDDELEIRLFGGEHAEELYCLINANRDHLRKWLPWVDRTQSIKDVHEYIINVSLQNCQDKGFSCAILYSGKLAGAIAHHQIDQSNRSVKLGYWLDQQLTGKGLVTRCCAEIIKHTFENMSINRISINAAVENMQSRAIPERLGFVFEGIKRDAEWLGSHFVNHAVYSLLRAEWLKDMS
jgi:ribosomal-protein-serine acetyltransferase